MRTIEYQLQSMAPYSQSGAYEVPKQDKELPDAYEERTWKHRCHFTSTGYVEIPPMAFKNLLTSAAQYLGVKVKGKRNATYTKHFKSGIFIMDAVVLQIKESEVESERLFVPSDGVSGGGKRVWKRFPIIHKWEGKLTVHVLDGLLTEEVVTEHLTEGGKFIGVGRFRPERNGFYGRFKVVGKPKEIIAQD